MIAKLLLSLVIGILTIVYCIGAYVSIAIEKIRKMGEKK